MTKDQKLRNHLNYFCRYEHKDDLHEDQLTRAYLVLLKNIPMAFVGFYDLFLKGLKDSMNKTDADLSLDDIFEGLPTLSSMEYGETIEVKTQVTDIRECNRLASVLLTNKIPQDCSAVNKTRSNRARYDGEVYIGTDLGIIIENKPESENVWKEQLHPSESSLPDGFKPEEQIIKVPSVIMWADIIAQLRNLFNSGQLSAAEKNLIGDFFDFIESSPRYSSLQPYGTFEICKGNLELIEKHLINFLEENVVKGPVTTHRGWASKIDVPESYKELKFIGFELNPKATLDNKDLAPGIYISMWYGDVNQQAKEFYKLVREKGIDKIVDQLEDLKEKGWIVRTNFHLLRCSVGINWFKMPKEDARRYIDFWKDWDEEFVKQKKTWSEVLELLEKLENEKFLTIPEELRSEEFSDAPYNVCPSLGIQFGYSFEELGKLEEKGELADDMKKRIKEGLSLTGIDPQDIVKE